MHEAAAAARAAPGQPGRKGAESKIGDIASSDRASSGRHRRLWFREVSTTRRLLSSQVNGHHATQDARTFPTEA